MLAIVGLFVVAPSFRALALIFVGYETVAAWVFAGTTRYRVPVGLRARAARRGGDREVPFRSAARARSSATVRASSGRPPRSARCSGPRGSARPRARAPARPIAAARGRGRSRAAASRAASASASPGGTSRPVSPSRTRSSSPPIDAAITGRARSIASSATIPKPSPSDGTTTASDSSIAALDRRHVAEEAHRVERGRARARDPSARARGRRGRRCRAARRAARRARARNARSSTTWPLIGIRRPMQRKRGASPAYGSRLRAGGDPVVDDLEVRLGEALGLGEVAREAARDRDLPVRERADRPVAEREQAPLAELVEAVLRREPHRHARDRARPSGRTRRRGRGACAGSSAGA